jgi:hypothetical protein
MPPLPPVVLPVLEVPVFPPVLEAPDPLVPLPVVLVELTVLVPVPVVCVVPAVVWLQATAARPINEMANPRIGPPERLRAPRSSRAQPPSEQLPIPKTTPAQVGASGGQSASIAQLPQRNSWLLHGPASPH